MNPQVNKIVKMTTVVATVTVSYFLLTADYGPEPNVLDPVSLFYSFSIVLVTKPSKVQILDFQFYLQPNRG